MGCTLKPIRFFHATCILFTSYNISLHYPPPPPAQRFTNSGWKAGISSLLASAFLLTPFPAKAQTAPPDNLRVTSSNGVATVRWDAVTGASGYDIEHRRAGYGESWSTTCTASSGSTASCATTGLRGDTMYEVRVRVTGGTWTGAVRFNTIDGSASLLAELESSFPNVDFTNQGVEHTEGHVNAIRSGSRDLPDNCTNNPLNTPGCAGYKTRIDHRTQAADRRSLLRGLTYVGAQASHQASTKIL